MTQSARFATKSVQTGYWPAKLVTCTASNASGAPSRPTSTMETTGQSATSIASSSSLRTHLKMDRRSSRRASSRGRRPPPTTPRTPTTRNQISNDVTAARPPTFAGTDVTRSSARDATPPGVTSATSRSWRRVTSPPIRKRSRTSVPIGRLLIILET